MNNIVQHWIKEGRCSSSLLAAGRAELRMTQLTRSSRRHIEGAAGCRLTTQRYGAQLRWKGWLCIYLDPQPTLSTFQVGGNRSKPTRKPTTFGRALSTRRKPTTFGRALYPEKTHDFWQSVDYLFSHECSESEPRFEPTISEVKGACPDDCATKAPVVKMNNIVQHC